MLKRIEYLNGVLPKSASEVMPGTYFDEVLPKQQELFDLLRKAERTPRVEELRKLYGIK